MQYWDKFKGTQIFSYWFKIPYEALWWPSVNHLRKKHENVRQTWRSWNLEINLIGTKVINFNFLEILQIWYKSLLEALWGQFLNHMRKTHEILWQTWRSLNFEIICFGARMSNFTFVENSWNLNKLPWEAMRWPFLNHLRDLKRNF